MSKCKIIFLIIFLNLTLFGSINVNARPKKRNRYYNSYYTNYCNCSKCIRYRQECYWRQYQSRMQNYSKRRTEAVEGFVGTAAGVGVIYLMFGW